MEITEAEIIEFLKKYEEATNTHDFSNVAPMIHPMAIYRFNDGDYGGIGMIKGAFESTWERIKNEKYSILDLQIYGIDSNSVFITYTFAWTGIVDGKEKSDGGRGTNIIVRNIDRLQFILEHLSK